MSVLIFIVVLVVLILVHEFGHFVTAKLAKMRVDEFGIGYPPKLFGVRKGETEYTINALPFGGFVKIFGEDGIATADRTLDPRAFTSKPRFIQAIVLVSGVAMNLLLAYVLFVALLYIGVPRALSDEEVSRARDLTLAVSQVMPDSPAEEAGLKPGDLIQVAKTQEAAWRPTDTETFSHFVDSTQGSAFALTLDREGKEETVQVAAEQGTIESEPTRYALGVSVAPVGIVPLSFMSAIYEGAILTYGVTLEILYGLGQFFGGILTFSADLSQVTGPLGIAEAVGTASSTGITTLLTLVALISINLAIINLIPVPALDGGRLLFVIIESIIRRPISPKISQAVNTAGFAFLILLMVVVTFHDIYKLVV